MACHGVRGQDGRIWWGRQARRVVVRAREAQPCIDSRVANQISPELLAPRFPRKRGCPTGIFDKRSARSARRMQLTAGSALRLLESRSPPFEAPAFRLFSMGRRVDGSAIAWQIDLLSRGIEGKRQCLAAVGRRCDGGLWPPREGSNAWFGTQSKHFLVLLAPRIHCKSWGWAAAAGGGE